MNLRNVLKVGLILFLTAFTKSASVGTFEDEVSENNEVDLTNKVQPLILDEILKGIRDFFSFDCKDKCIPRKEHIQFLAFNPKHENESDAWIELHEDNMPTLLKPKKPFKIAIHGFLASCNKSDFSVDIFDAYTATNPDYNLICVDWGVMAYPSLSFSALFHYPKAVNYTLFVGETLATVIKGLIDSGYVTDNGDNVHLIGHSLGAHVAGVCGHEMYKQYKVKIGRITGLDPAGPFFYLMGDSHKGKLGKDDAEFVDVIYSNVGQLGVSSKDMDLGDVGFIPNGGKRQTFCKDENLILDLAEKVTGLCSHQAAVKMFTKSITEKINACSCESWTEFMRLDKDCDKNDVQLFGDQVSTSVAKGKYCLELNTLKS